MSPLTFFIVLLVLCVVYRIYATIRYQHNLEAHTVARLRKRIDEIDRALSEMHANACSRPGQYRLEIWEARRWDALEIERDELDQELTRIANRML